MLTLEGIHTFYGPIEALKGVSLKVEEGETVALIGANGAGKTTTLMSISGVQPPNKGRIVFQGNRLDGLAPHEIVKRGICQVPEGRRIFPGLTVLENLEMGAYVHAEPGGTDRELERVFETFPLLRERSRQPGGTLSGGEQQMLAIGRALMGRPKLLLLDEPSLGLAPIVVQRIFKIIRQINEQGKTILLVEQNARAALSLAHRAYVMETGRIVMEDRADVLLKDSRVRSAYLGENP
jgi:branched-chain amino acid transport system ATP-binding protein